MLCKAPTKPLCCPQHRGNVSTPRHIDNHHNLPISLEKTRSHHLMLVRVTQDRVLTEYCRLRDTYVWVSVLVEEGWECACKGGRGGGGGCGGYGVVCVFASFSLFYSILGCVLPLQEVALCQSSSFSHFCKWKVRIASPHWGTSTFTTDNNHKYLQF